jgi:hypothetical protein
MTVGGKVVENQACTGWRRPARRRPILRRLQEESEKETA